MPAEGVSIAQTLVLEAILTFFLVNAILNTAVSGKAGDFAPIAIGLTLAFCILMGGPLTGASLNPVRTLGPALFTGTLGMFWVYLVGTLVGAAGAGLLYRGLLKDDGE
jgi:aquaporin Z